MLQLLDLSQNKSVGFPLSVAEVVPPDLEVPAGQSRAGPADGSVRH